MSQTPYMYSPYPALPTQPPLPYAPASAQPLQPPGLFYGSPQESSPSTAPGNPAAVSALFEQNGNRIPGLGMSSGAGPSFSTSVRAGEGKPEWHQGPVSSSIGFPPGGREHSMGVIGRASQPFPSEPAVRPPQFREVDDNLEEGELSEGMFEDLYEPKDVDGKIGETSNRSLRGPGVDQTGSVGDADGSSIYDTGSARDDAVVDSTSASLPAVEEDEYSPGEYYEPEYQPRERSGSYSPYLSPTEVQVQANVSKITPREAKREYIL